MSHLRQYHIVFGAGIALGVVMTLAVVGLLAFVAWRMRRRAEALSPERLAWEPSRLTPREQAYEELLADVRRGAR